MDVGKIDLSTTYDNEGLILPKSLPIFKGGWYLLVYPISIKNTSSSGLIMPTEATKAAQELLTCGLVVKKGPLAYKQKQWMDPATGEYMDLCDAGDWVVFSRAAHAYTVVHEGVKFWVMPDDAILYTVGHPNQLDPRYQYDALDIESFKEQLKTL